MVCPKRRSKENLVDIEAEYASAPEINIKVAGVRLENAHDDKSSKTYLKSVSFKESNSIHTAN